MASFVWMLLAEPTYNRTRRAALAWRARILSQEALRNVSRFSSSAGAFCLRMITGATFYFKDASTQSNGAVKSPKQTTRLGLFLAAFWPLPTANSHGTVIPLKTQLVYRVRVACRDKLELHRLHFAT